MNQFLISRCPHVLYEFFISYFVRRRRFVFNSSRVYFFWRPSSLIRQIGLVPDPRGPPDKQHPRTRPLLRGGKTPRHPVCGRGYRFVPRRREIQTIRRRRRVLETYTRVRANNNESVVCYYRARRRA